MPDFPELPICAKNAHCENGVNARSAYPVDFKVGKWIVITDCSGNEYNLTQKTNIIAHELGHTLGFRHSDFGCALNEEEAYDFFCLDTPAWGATHIFGTPPCDQNSLMYSSSQDNTFTDDDKRAARILYPISGAPSPTISSLVIGNCGTHCRVWTAYITNPVPWYTLRLRLKNMTTNQIVKVGNVIPGNSVVTSLSYGLAGNYSLQLLGMNYQGNITTYSAYYTVVVP